MYWGYPFDWASLIVLFACGFFIARLLSGRIVGALLTFFLGVAVFSILLSSWTSGQPSYFLMRLTDNLSHFLYANFMGMVGFCAGVWVGWRKKRPLFWNR
ncbi:MAG: hypothetical protein SCM96_15915, partial [Acidobacteriota bacterium]|nr:hypothetical protein [Acidobacteriota bacterium]